MIRERLDPPGADYIDCDCERMIVGPRQVGEIVNCSACGARYTRDSAGVTRLD